MNTFILSGLLFCTLSGCSLTQRGATSGAALGTIVGGISGGLMKNNAQGMIGGALIGGAAGAGMGAIYGKQEEIVKFNKQDQQDIQNRKQKILNDHRADITETKVYTTDDGHKTTVTISKKNNSDVTVHIS